MKRAIVTAIFLCILAIGCFAGGNMEEINSQTISQVDIETIAISYTADTVTILRSGNDDLVLQEYMSRNRAAHHADIAVSGGELSIRGGWIIGNNSRIEVYIPASYRKSLGVSTSSGGIYADTDLEGYRELDMAVSSGSLRLRNIGAEKIGLTVRSGNIEAGTLLGNTVIAMTSESIALAEMRGTSQEIRSFSGPVRIGKRAGESIKIKGTSSRIDIQEAEGKMDIRSSSGSVYIAHATGEGIFDVRSGNIYLGMSRIRGDLSLNIGSGPLAVTIPQNLAFTLDAESRSGGLDLIAGNGTYSLHNANAVLHDFGQSPDITIRVRVGSGRAPISETTG